MADNLSPAARRRALQLRRARLREKIVFVENDIAGLGSGGNRNLFEHPALESLRARLSDLQGRAGDIEAELRSTGD